MQIERRQRQCLVVDDLDRRPAPAEHDDGAEGRIVGKTQDQLARLRLDDHRLHDDALDAGFGTQLPRPRENVGGSRAHGLRRGQIEDDAADVGLVDDVARHDLQHDCGALREHLAGVGDGLLDIGRSTGRYHRDVIGSEQVLDLDRIEPFAAVRDRRGDDLPGSRDVGHERRRASRAEPGSAPLRPRDAGRDA